MSEVLTLGMAQRLAAHMEKHGLDSRIVESSEIPGGYYLFAEYKFAWCVYRIKPITPGILAEMLKVQP